MKTHSLLFGIFCLFFTPSIEAKIWINEFTQSNIDLVRDDLQDFPDSWVELYNDSEQPVNIQNWYISDTENYRDGWRFNQSATVPGKGYLLVYCDKVASGLHTSFRLDSGKGGAIYLFDNSGNVVDQVTNIPKQPAPNIARGRTTDGGSVWENFITATPKSSNNGGKHSDRVLDHPVFSQPGGVYKSAVNITLSLPDNVPASVTLSDIHYTLDNSEPTAGSPAYSGSAIRISSPTVLKAKVIHPDYLVNRSQAHSYIVVSRDLKLPIISISLDNSYLWDDEFGIYCKGNGLYGKAGNGVEFKANWNNNWRRPLNFEYFPSQSSAAVLNQLGEMRISGKWSRANAQKSFAVYAHKRFGVKRFEYDLFSEKPEQEIKSFLIRNSGNDFWYTHFRDAAIQLLMGGKTDIDYQAYQPAIFYLNGRYWGIQNLRERSNEDFILANYAIEDIDLITSWWGGLKVGDKTDWNKLMNELRKSSSQINYQWLMDQVDINEFINYMILEIYVSNTDFPGNNMTMWKPKTADGKWRFILKDLDQGLGIWGSNQPNHNALQYNTQNNDDDRKLFRALLSQDSFKKEFYSRFAIYMGDLLHYNATSQVIDSIQQMLEPEMENHILRWRDEVWWRDMNSWRNEVSQMKPWCKNRNTYVYTHLRSYFNLGSIMKMTLETAPELNGTPVISINGTVLQKPLLDGYFFQKETVRLRFEGETQQPYGWEITAIVNGQTSTVTDFQPDLAYTIEDKCTSLKIRVIDNPLSIRDVVFTPIKVSSADRQLHIEGLEGDARIFVYDMAGRLLHTLQTRNYAVDMPVNQPGVFIVKINTPGQVYCEKTVVL